MMSLGAQIEGILEDHPGGSVEVYMDDGMYGAIYQKPGQPFDAYTEGRGHSIEDAVEALAGELAK